MRLLAGTSGFAYDEWRGSFYPADLPAADRLRFYAERFDAVEINNTFYRMPAAITLQLWKTQVAASFTFVLKAPQRITHNRRLRDAAEPLDALISTAAVLGHSLGPLFFQLPPNMKKDLPRLVDFLALLPDSVRAAFEFRHSSWFDDNVFDALRTARCALCIADTLQETSPMVATAGWGYLRLRREQYEAADLADWVARIRTQQWSDVFVFFKHEDAGTGPQLARQFADLFASTEG
jgi:uncharacterized protein YecE (DUF72 family)